MSFVLLTYYCLLISAASILAAAEAGAETVLLVADQMLPVDVERRIIEVGLKLDLNVMLVASRDSETDDENEQPKPVIPDPEDEAGP